MSSGLNTAALNVYEVNGLGFQGNTAEPYMTYWTSSVVGTIEVAAVDLSDVCVYVDYVPTLQRTTYVPSRPSTVC